MSDNGKKVMAVDPQAALAALLAAADTEQVPLVMECYSVLQAALVSFTQAICLLQEWGEGVRGKTLNERDRLLNRTREYLQGVAVRRLDPHAES